MRGGGGRRGDREELVVYCRTFVCGGATRGSEWRRVEAGCTHTCAAAHALGARQCHHQLVTAGCFLLVPPQRLLLVPAHRVRVRLLSSSVCRRFRSR